MKSSAVRIVLTGLLAAGMLGGSGWVIYSKFIGGLSPTAGVNDSDSEFAGLIDPDTVLSNQEIAPPTADDFDRLSIGTDVQPVSGNSDSDEFVISDVTDSTSFDTDDSDSFVIGDQAAVDQYMVDDANADEFPIATNSENTDVPVTPIFDGEESSNLQTGDQVDDGNQFSISDVPLDLGSGEVVQPEDIADTSGTELVETPGQLTLTDEPNLSPLPLPNNLAADNSLSIGDSKSTDLDVGDVTDAPMPSEFPEAVLGQADPSIGATRQAGIPGSLQLEGQQAPMLTVEKVAPAEVQVNRSAVFTTKIKNTGKVSAHEIRVTDFVPRGARLESAHPEFIQASDGSIQWVLGSLEPGDEATVSMKVVPLAEGEIGSVAKVSFEALASVRTVSTRPQLSITQTLPEKVLIGESVLVNVTVANPGSGDATGVVLEADIPAELSHVAGNELEYPVGTLRPGQQKQVALRLTAKAAGVVFNALTVRGNGQMEDRSVQQIEVVAPDVQVGLRGPRIRYLDREATYAVDVANPGTASARNISLVAFLSKGLKFVSTDHFGEYDAREHAVYWKLEELPPNIRDSVKLTAVAVEPGEQKIVLEGSADLGVKDSFDHIVRVESVPELEFSVKDTADPIEVGSDTTYEIKVVNRGTRTATGVQIYAAFPESLRAVQGGGPSDLRIEGQNALFAPLDRLPPNQEAVFRVKAKALGSGDNVIKVQMISDDVNIPVTKEESTRIYSDN